MAVAGIVAEYNPFHTGHAYQLAETRRALGEGGEIVCVMSGNFVQRGDCAVLDKWSRAKCALLGGADLVLELPTVWAVSSAECFARGAVEILAATGVVNTLSFGSESGELAELRATADCLNSAEYGVRLRTELDKGVSFATARARAVTLLLGTAGECLDRPNNNLAVEYLRALPAGMGAMTVKRVGAGHNEGQKDGHASASAIRELLLGGELAQAKAYLSPGTAEALERTMEERCAPTSLLHCQRAVLARLRGMTEADFAALPDSGAAEGLPARLVRAAHAARTLEEFWDGAKTKRYAHARLRRLALWAFLGLTAADRPEGVPYVRVLGMNERGKALLGRMKKTCALPVITKAAHAKKLGGLGRALFETEARCTDLYALCGPRVQPCGLEWTRGPAFSV